LEVLFVEGFTSTEPISESWVEMKKEEATVIQSLGNIYFIMLGTAVYAFIWLIFRIIANRWEKAFLRRIEKSMRHELYWGMFLTLFLEGYLDFTIGSFTNYEQFFNVTWPDYVNSTTLILLAPVVFIGPLLTYPFLRANSELLPTLCFYRTYGALFENFRVDNDRDKQVAFKLSCWFCIRRFLFAVILIPLRH
jgi:hypothetical protein